VKGLCKLAAVFIQTANAGRRRQIICESVSDCQAVASARSMRRNFSSMKLINHSFSCVDFVLAIFVQWRNFKKVGSVQLRLTRLFEVGFLWNTHCWIAGMMHYFKSFGSNWIRLSVWRQIIFKIRRINVWAFRWDWFTINSKPKY